MDFGYTISTPRTIDLDGMDPALRDHIVERERSILLCIGCGSCAATCTAAQFAPISLRQIQHLIRRGQYDQVREMLSRCMLCGKCRMVCPRGVNTRAVIHTLLDTL